MKHKSKEFIVNTPFVTSWRVVSLRQDCGVEPRSLYGQGDCLLREDLPLVRQVLRGRRPWWDRQGCFFVDPSWVEPSVDSRNRYPSWVEVSINVDVRQHHLSEPRQKHPCLQLRLNSPNPSLYIFASCMLYFPLPIYSLHACLNCVKIACTVLK